MDNKGKLTAIAEAGLISAVTALFMTITIYVPVFNLFGYFFLGLPLAVLVARRGRIVAVCAGVVAFIITMVLTGRFAGTFGMMILGVVPGMFCGYFVKSKWTYVHSTLMTAVVFSVGVFVSIVFIKFVLPNAGIVEQMGEVISHTKDVWRQVAEEILAKRGVVVDSGQLSSVMTDIENSIYLLIPSIIILSACIYGFITTYCCRLIFVKLKIPTRYVTKFYMIKAKKSICYVVFGISILMYFFESETILIALNNVSLLIYMSIGICGLALVDFYLKNQIKSGYWRFAVYVSFFMLCSIFMVQIFNLLIMAGFLDGLFNFRKIKKI